MESTADLSEEAWPNVTLLTRTTGHSDAFVSIMCGGFRVDILPDKDDLRGPGDQKANSPYQTFLEFNRRMLQQYDTEARDDMQDWMLEPLLPLLQQLDNESIKLPRSRLYNYLNPPLLSLALLANGSELLPRFSVKDNQDDRGVFKGIRIADLSIDDDLLADFPRYSSNDLLIDENRHRAELASNEIPRVVRTCEVPATKMAVKYMTDIQSFRRETYTLLRIRKEALYQHVNLPETLGFLEDPRTGLVQGILTRFIEHRFTLETALEQLRPHDDTWGVQIEAAVHALHDAGLIWGDAAPQNVLIDEDSNAWVIDFGGGYRPAWVECQLQDSKEGDAQALSKIKDCCCSAP